VQSLTRKKPALSPTCKPDCKSSATAKALKHSATIAIEGTNIVFIEVSPQEKGMPPSTYSATHQKVSTYLIRPPSASKFSEIWKRRAKVKPRHSQRVG
jgi:hypothetical protein